MQRACASRSIPVGFAGLHPAAIFLPLFQRSNGTLANPKRLALPVFVVPVQQSDWRFFRQGASLSVTTLRKHGTPTIDFWFSCFMHRCTRTRQDYAQQLSNALRTPGLATAHDRSTSRATAAAAPCAASTGYGSDRDRPSESRPPRAWPCR